MDPRVSNHYLETEPPRGTLHPTVAKWPVYGRPITKKKLRRVILRDGMRCHWCRRVCNPDLVCTANAYPTLEHLIRRADGGSGRMHNLVLACRKCNNSRQYRVAGSKIFGFFNGAAAAMPPGLRS